jgi:hypothetical protein
VGGAEREGSLDGGVLDLFQSYSEAFRYADLCP